MPSNEESKARPVVSGHGPAEQASDSSKPYLLVDTLTKKLKERLGNQEWIKFWQSYSQSSRE